MRVSPLTSLNALRSFKTVRSPPRKLVRDAEVRSEGDFEMRMSLSVLFTLFCVGFVLPARAGQHAAPHAAGAPDSRVTERAVLFQSGDAKLAGTVLVPPGERHPAIVILHGSGPATRDFVLYRSAADLFAKHGFAVLLFDKRGTGESGGSYVEAPDLRVSATDATAAVRFMAAQPEVDASRLGVWGISQGGWVAQILGAESPEVKFVIDVSGPGVSPLEQNVYSRSMELAEQGFSLEEVGEVIRVRRLLWTYYQTERGRDEIEHAWTWAKSRPWFAKMKWPDAPPMATELSDDQKHFYRVHCAYEPAPVVARIKVPVLYLLGGKDRHIPVPESQAALTAAFAKSGNPDVTIRVFPNAGHGIQTVTGAAECLTCMKEHHESGKFPAFEMDPDYAPTMIAWLEKRFSGGAKR